MGGAKRWNVSASQLWTAPWLNISEFLGPMGISIIFLKKATLVSSPSS